MVMSESRFPCKIPHPTPKVTETFNAPPVSQVPDNLQCRAGVIRRAAVSQAWKIAHQVILRRTVAERMHLISLGRGHMKWPAVGYFARWMAKGIDGAPAKGGIGLNAPARVVAIVPDSQSVQAVAAEYWPTK